MKDSVKIQLLPWRKTLTVQRGSSLHDSLFLQGVEFPCGGHGRCKGCRIKVLEGVRPPVAEEIAKFSPAELAEGWRLACCTRAENDLTVELAQWEAAILGDDSKFTFTPQEGFGIAVDLGTTTLVAQLLDLRSGYVRAVRTAFNPQARYGADVMSRIEAAISGKETPLTQIIRHRIGELATDLLLSAGVAAGELKKIVIVGNTVMHHLFCGFSVEPLAQEPFHSEQDGLKIFTGGELGWKICAGTKVSFLPCLGSFVGSDILAGILATDMHRSEAPKILVDLGTNGEIVIGNRDRLLCASTAAGPAFEGARISMGMRATSGAISEVTLRDGKFDCRVLGGVWPAGICGSGLVDAVAACLDLGWIKPSGRIVVGELLPINGPVSLTQCDIRELQYAKGAIAAGLRILSQRWGIEPQEVTQVFLAGAFGNYINRASAQRIGLLQFPLEKVVPIGNSALLGAKMALFNSGEEDYAGIRAKVRHVSLNEDAAFQDIYAAEMVFPAN